MARRRNGKNQQNQPANNGFVLNKGLLEDITYNAIRTRRRFFEQYLDPRRSIDDECGYPRTEQIDFAAYRHMYDREPIATRVVELWPKRTWRVEPVVFETEDSKVETEFEKAVNEQLKRSNELQNSSKLRSPQGNAIWEILCRADILSGIGHYGGILIGVDDGAELHEPIQPRQGMKVLFTRALDEGSATIGRLDNDLRSPRYGMPENYNVNLFSGAPATFLTTQTITSLSAQVHWTRIVHLADNLETSEVIGVPRMRPVFNRIMDLHKLYGGSAEMHWRGAFPGLSIESTPDAPLTQSDVEGMKESAENYMNSLQRYIASSGFTVKSLAPQVVDPSPNIDKQIEAIAIYLGIPKRIFMGSERGELASGQDQGEAQEVTNQRRNRYATPRIIAPFIDRLIAIGVLPEPKEYFVSWPEDAGLPPQEQAEVGNRTTDALAKYIAGDVQSLIQPLDYLTRVLGYSMDEASEIIDAAEQAFLEEQSDLPEEEGQQVDEESLSEEDVESEPNETTSLPS